VGAAARLLPRALLLAALLASLPASLPALLGGRFGGGGAIICAADVGDVVRLAGRWQVEEAVCAVQLEAAAVGGCAFTRLLRPTALTGLSRSAAFGSACAQAAL